VSATQCGGKIIHQNETDMKENVFGKILTKKKGFEPFSSLKLVANVGLSAGLRT
jgi:hypothetical protein